MLRLFFPKISLFFLIVYFIYNFSNVGQVGGVWILFLSYVITLLISFFNIKKIEFRLSWGLFCLLFFILYYLLRLYFDANEFHRIRAEIFGSTSGLFYYLIIGFAANLIVFFNRSGHFVSVYFLLFLQSFVLFLLLIILAGYIGELRPDVFLVINDQGAYQRPGNMISILSILLSYLFIFSGSNKNQLIITRLSQITYILMMIILASIAQVIGSNMGFVVVFAIMLITLFHYYDLFVRVRFGHLKIPYFLKLHLGFFLFIVVFVVLFLFFKIYNFEYLSKIRIFGFGDGIPSSFTSRYDIFINNFSIHFFDSPFFGNSVIDRQTTGEGTYVHSFLSVLTHTGIFGAFILVLSLLLVFYSIFGKYKYFDTKYRNKYISYDLSIIFVILLFCLFATTFTWSVLWFVLGINCKLISSSGWLGGISSNRKLALPANRLKI